MGAVATVMVLHLWRMHVWLTCMCWTMRPCEEEDACVTHVRRRIHALDDSRM